MISNLQDYKIQKIVKNIKNTSAQVRSEAMIALSKVSKDEIHTELGIYILKEAAKGCPASEFMMHDPSNILVTFVTEGAKEEYLPVLEEIFPHLSIWARNAALRLISLLGTKSSAETYLRIVEKYAKKVELDQLPIEYDPKNEEVVDVLFPSLFHYLNHPDINFYILSYANGCLEEGTMKQEMIAPFTTDLRQLYWRAEKQYEQDFQVLGEEAHWDPETQDIRDLLGMLLDVIGDIEGEEIDKFMDEMMEHPDKKLSFFAVLSKLRKKKSVDQRCIDDILNDLEMRSYLYDELESMNLLHLAKEESVTQEKMAEGDMVRWLSFPTELGHVPSDITQEAVITKNDETYYVYRFKSDHPVWEELGYVAGISGPFKPGGKRVFGDISGTMSIFEPWDSKTIEEHVDMMLAIVNEYREEKNTETL